MKNFKIFLLVFIFLLFSCSVEKRLYQKGYHIEWKNKIKGHSKASPPLPENFLIPLHAFHVSDVTDNQKTLMASKTNKEIDQHPFLRHKALSYFDRKTGVGSITSRSCILLGDSITKKNIAAENSIANEASDSFILGIISLICTLFFFLYLTIPVAIICGILAIKKGRKAIELMGSYPDLNSRYRKKARSGIRLGMSFFVFLITLAAIGLLIGVFFFAILLIVYFVLTLYIDQSIIFIYILAALMAVGIAWLYIFVLKKIFKTIPTKKVPL